MCCVLLGYVCCVLFNVTGLKLLLRWVLSAALCFNLDMGLLCGVVDGKPTLCIHCVITTQVCIVVVRVVCVHCWNVWCPFAIDI